MFLEDEINGFEVSLDTDCDGVGDDSPDRVTGCWINKGRFSGSLELIRAIGGLEDVDGNFLSINSSTLRQIESWAESNGY